jgi:predicted HTH domain antitoxin
MNVQTNNVTVQQILELAQSLSPIDQRVLVERLNRQIDDSLPEKATVEEAIALYQADKCSLGRAAELVSISRWEFIAMLKKRNIPVIVETDLTAAEMDAIEKELEHEGVLCS